MPISPSPDERIRLAREITYYDTLCTVPELACERFAPRACASLSRLCQYARSDTARRTRGECRARAPSFWPSARSSMYSRTLTSRARRRSQSVARRPHSSPSPNGAMLDLLLDAITVLSAK